MEALRLILHQNSANYKKEETVDNKTTYPLPPISTVVGTLHYICGYTEYVSMEVSIQGKYESLRKKAYTDYCFLNSLQDDRGILVKMKNANMMSTVFEKVAVAKHPQGNSFRRGTTIQVYNKKLLDDFRALRDLNDEIGELKKNRLDPILKKIKSRKKYLAEKKKIFEKKSVEYEKINKREKEIKQIEKDIKEWIEEYKKTNYTIPISQYRSLTKSLKFYEILDNVTLVLHVKAEKQVLLDILDHIYDLKSIGRSEDTVSVLNAEIVELEDDLDEEVVSEYPAYIAYEMIKDNKVWLKEKNGNISGTRYYLNKNYEIIKGKRIFSKKKVLYVSQHFVDSFREGFYLDRHGEKCYIVNFLELTQEEREEFEERKNMI